jgi:hypothetical protein
MASNQDLSILLLSPSGGDKLLAQSVQIIEWNASEGMKPLNVTLEYGKLDSGQWTPIATGLANNGSLTWTVPNETGNFEIRAAVNDSSSPPRTALTMVTVEIAPKSPELPLFPITAALLTTIATIAAVLLILKRKQKRQKN